MDASRQEYHNWSSPHLTGEKKYSKLKNFEMEVRNIIMTKCHMIKNWLGKEGLHFIAT